MTCQEGGSCKRMICFLPGMAYHARFARIYARKRWPARCRFAWPTGIFDPFSLHLCNCDYGPVAERIVLIFRNQEDTRETNLCACSTAVAPACVYRYKEISRTVFITIIGNHSPPALFHQGLSKECRPDGSRYLGIKSTFSICWVKPF